MDKQSELTIIELLRRIWLARRVVLFVVILSVVTAIFIIIFSQREYTAQCEIIAQNSSSSILPQMASLASLAGFSVDMQASGEILSSQLYENILTSTSFCKKIIYIPIYFQSLQRRMAIVDYIGLGKSHYQPSFESIGHWLAKFFKTEQNSSQEAGAHIEGVTAQEYEALKYLQQRVEIENEPTTGCVTIRATLPDAVAAAELVETIVKELEQYIIYLKTQRVTSNMLFIRERCQEAYIRFDSLQRYRAMYKDANVNISKYRAQAELERIDAEYNLAADIYRELSMQLEQAMISVKEQTPVLSIISPVITPFKPSKPRKMIIFITFVVGGFLVGTTIGLLWPVLANITGCRVPDYADWVSVAKKGREERSYVE